MTAKISRDSDKFMLRLPDGMRDQLKASAANSGRSMNTEIVARLEQSFDGAFTDLSSEGLVAISKRLEASVAVSEELMFGIRDRLPALEAFMAEEGISRREAIRNILSDWLAGHGYLPLDPSED